MPLTVLRTEATRDLWRAFSDSFMAGTRTHGPGGYNALAWVTHSLQRDQLYRDAANAGLKGWLNPPIAFFSELRDRFDITAKPVGLMERLALLHTLSESEEAFPGLDGAVERVLTELLPEGVTSTDLRAALEPGAVDAFAQERNGRVINLLDTYNDELARTGRYDPRAVHSIIAARIAAGGLPAAIGGASELHIYGLTTPHTRRALLAALDAQPDVNVFVYALESPAGDDEWADFRSEFPHPRGGRVRDDSPPPSPHFIKLQPAPDEQREFEYVSLEIKRLLLAGCAPDHIAVVARTGRIDARLAFEALEKAGIPTTARLRWKLEEVPALKAILLLFRGGALGWPYRALRHVLESSYFDLPLNLKSLDRAATERRIAGLDQWRKLPELAAVLEPLAVQASRLDAPRPIRDWIEITRDTLDPGWFDFRARVCRTPGDRYDIQRLDQQGILTISALLAEWGAAESGEDPVTIAQWYKRLRQFLGSNELALSTPLRTGVQVLEAHEAALVPFEHVFLVHANDGEFPKGYQPGGLFTEAEREALAARGIPLTTRTSHLLRERALWRAVTSGPNTTITYRTADAGGVPLLPSLLVPADVKPEEEIPRVRFVWDDPFTQALADRAAMQRFANERAGPSAPRRDGTAPTSRLEILRRALLAGFAESRRIESADGSRPAGVLGRWNGQVSDPRILEHLAGRFTPDYLWSASQLESYGQNPFMFLLQRVLRIEEKDEAEEDTTVLTLGSAGHSLLEAFYARLAGRIPKALDDPTAAEFEAIADEVFARMEADPEWLGLPAMWGVRKRQVRAQVKAYLAWELPKLRNWVPTACEFSFGDEARPAPVLDHPGLSGSPARLKLRGKIDRVDLMSGLHRVIDYKSGTPPGPKGYSDGGVLQGPLYMAALQACGFAPGEAEYRSIRKPGTAANVKWGDAKAERALTLAHSIPGRILAGHFEPSAAASCGWKDWWPGGAALVRVKHVIDKDCCRFDE